MRGFAGAVTMALGLAACSPVGVLNAMAPIAGIVVTKDVPYAPGPRHSLDIYVPGDQSTSGSGSGPSAGAGKRVPVVVFIYGGGWKDGDKAMYRFVAANLAAKGFLTVVPDYRLYPKVRFPAFIQDAAAAVAWTRTNIARYGGDPDRIFLMGHSAGAQIVAMLTLDKQWLRAEGLDPDRDVSGMIGLAGPYDFLPLRDPELETIFAPAGDLRLTQPITFARGDAPPMFLAAGTGDTTVYPRNTTHLAAAVRGDGGRVEEKLYRGIDHRLIIGSIAAPLRWFAPVLKDVTAFLRRWDGQGGGLAAAEGLDGVGGVAAAAPGVMAKVPVAAAPVTAAASTLKAAASTVKAAASTVMAGPGPAMTTGTPILATGTPTPATGARGIGSAVHPTPCPPPWS